MIKTFYRSLAVLALGLSGAAALAQGTEAIVSIDVTPVAGDPTRQAIALTISNAEADSILYIQ
ncbi:MAG: hypothetical protein QF920_05265, partial [Verrucomicrobiota bacterium]|nr:hypothetical protein [Verrucomicrobiota bacterium]